MFPAFHAPSNFYGSVVTSQNGGDKAQLVHGNEGGSESENYEYHGIIYDMAMA